MTYFKQAYKDGRLVLLHQNGTVRNNVYPIVEHKGFRIWKDRHYGYFWQNASYFETLAECEADIDTEIEFAAKHWENM